jgi:hypothetical protein
LDFSKEASYAAIDMVERASIDILTSGSIMWGIWEKATVKGLQPQIRGFAVFGVESKLIEIRRSKPQKAFVTSLSLANR